MSDRRDIVRVHLELREFVGVFDGADKYTYTPIPFPGPDGGVYLHTHTPPAVGDRFVLLLDGDSRSPSRAISALVVEREWHYSRWGSANWPYSVPQSTVGPLLKCVVVEVNGLYADEAPREDDDG